jgi:acetyl-CoA synthetase
VFRALVEEAGGAWAADVHDLLELAKAMAARGPKPRRGGGLAILTCSGGDSGLGADEAARLRIELPPLAPATAAALRERLPDAATVANPLDYTAMIWGEADTLRDIVRLTGEDPGVGQVLVFYDRPPGIDGYQAESWDAVQFGILAGARESPVGTIVAATLPELLDDASAWAFACEGVPAVAGLRTGVACAAALASPPADPARLRAIAKGSDPFSQRNEVASFRRREGSDPSGYVSARTEMWLAEHDAKARLRAAGVPVVDGRLVAGEDDAVAALAELGGPVALKRSTPGLLHKAAAGALALDLATEEEVRVAYRRIGGPALVERMAAPGAELLVSVTREGVVPALVVGLGGAHAEVLDDVAVLPLPVTAERVERALRSLRGAPLLAGADLRAAAHLAMALPKDLALIECNPVIVGAHGAVVVDAVAKETAA